MYDIIEAVPTEGRLIYFRQLRNRDATVRSRERKKAYIRDLEVKSKYLEGKCRRLGRLLQCVMAENQAMRFSLENNVCGTSVAKQESAVLSEPLSLGSLFWFLCITCLFTLPPPLLSGSYGVQTLDKSKRYKASRTKMKAGLLLPRVLA
ncbi:hypothetical protein EUGRSUZ_G02751 [Eucalyptus grandis]|uniref:Uncharacterized protein n=2 Tax=Eucalyptus grandis TaxID=71139 RepID=A0ACC3K7E0_EUCGR|nr:hypothetical protein EUGRSUZ_G02751 [Eucalyptus grandis]